MKNWKDYITECSYKKSFMVCLQVLNQLLDREVKYLREIPQDRFSFDQLIEPVVLMVMAKIFAMIDPKNEYLKLIVNMSMFILFKAGMIDYLKDHLYLIMSAYGYETHYFQNLKVFYQSMLIHDLSEEKIEQIIESMDIPNMTVH